MKRNKTIRIVAFLAIALFALSLLSINVQLASAYTFPRSDNVALVPGAYCHNGGTLYTGSSWPDSLDFSFYTLSPVTIADASEDDDLLDDYDTIMIMAPAFNYAGLAPWTTFWEDEDFNSRITEFVDEGGKLIIYVSELWEDYYDWFSDFLIPFSIVNPGQTGAYGGTIINLEDDTLSSSVASDASYINLALMTAGTDAVGDASVITTETSGWYIDMTAINVDGDGGPVHAYGFYGDGLIIFNGLDIDYAASGGPTVATGGGEVQRVWWRELCGQDLGEGQSVSGLTLSPATATNPVDTWHTVTALVKDSINNPVPGVLVTFNILTGPNAGLTAQATTDANGEATYSWLSSTAGIDTVQASITAATGAAPITATATKTWYVPQTNVIPEVPLGTAAITATMMIGLAVFYTKRRTKTPKL